MRLVRWILLILTALHSVALAQPRAPQACRAVVEKILKGEDFSLQGFERGRVGTLSDAIVLRMTGEEWASALAYLRADLAAARARDFLTLTQTTIEKTLGRKLSARIRAPFLSVRETDSGIEAYGTRYFISHSGSNLRVFRIDVSENVTRNENGLVSHYALVKIHELNRFGHFDKIAYADFPHMHGRTPRWFHLHEARNGDVIGNIATTGFVKSVVADTVVFFRDSIKNNAF